MATALLGPDRIRFAVNHLVGDAVGGAAQQAFDTHDIPYRGAQGAGAQEGIVRLGPPNHRTRYRRTTAHQAGTVGHGLQVKRPRQP